MARIIETTNTPVIYDDQQGGPIPDAVASKDQQPVPQRGGLAQAPLLIKAPLFGDPDFSTLALATPYHGIPSSTSAASPQAQPSHSTTSSAATEAGEDVPLSEIEKTTRELLPELNREPLKRDYNSLPKTSKEGLYILLVYSKVPKANLKLFLSQSLRTDASRILELVSVLYDHGATASQLGIGFRREHAVDGQLSNFLSDQTNLRSGAYAEYQEFLRLLVATGLPGSSFNLQLKIPTPNRPLPTEVDIQVKHPDGKVHFVEIKSRGGVFNPNEQEVAKMRDHLDRMVAIIRQSPNSYLGLEYVIVAGSIDSSFVENWLGVLQSRNIPAQIRVVSRGNTTIYRTSEFVPFASIQYPSILPTRRTLRDLPLLVPRADRTSPPTPHEQHQPRQPAPDPARVYEQAYMAGRLARQAYYLARPVRRLSMTQTGSGLYFRIKTHIEDKLVNVVEDLKYSYSGHDVVNKLHWERFLNQVMKYSELNGTNKDAIRQTLETLGQQIMSRQHLEQISLAHSGPDLHEFIFGLKMMDVDRLREYFQSRADRIRHQTETLRDKLTKIYGPDLTTTEIDLLLKRLPENGNLHESRVSLTLSDGSTKEVTLGEAVKLISVEQAQGRQVTSQDPLIQLALKRPGIAGNFYKSAISILAQNPLLTERPLGNGLMFVMAEMISDAILGDWEKFSAKHAAINWSTMALTGAIGKVMIEEAFATIEKSLPQEKLTALFENRGYLNAKTFIQKNVPFYLVLVISQMMATGELNVRDLGSTAGKLACARVVSKGVMKLVSAALKIPASSGAGAVASLVIEFILLKGIDKGILWYDRQKLVSRPTLKMEDLLNQVNDSASPMEWGQLFEELEQARMFTSDFGELIQQYTAELDEVAAQVFMRHQNGQSLFKTWSEVRLRPSPVHLLKIPPPLRGGGEGEGDLCNEDAEFRNKVLPQQNIQNQEKENLAIQQQWQSVNEQLRELKDKLNKKLEQESDPLLKLAIEEYLQKTEVMAKVKFEARLLGLDKKIVLVLMAVETARVQQDFTQRKNEIIEKWLQDNKNKEVEIREDLPRMIWNVPKNSRHDALFKNRQFDELRRLGYKPHTAWLKSASFLQLFVLRRGMVGLQLS